MHFVKVCRGEEAPNCSVKDGLSALIVCDAVKRALVSGETVDIQQLKL
jgi:hypothetical protein